MLQRLKEEGMIPEAGANAETNKKNAEAAKKRKAEEAEAAAAEVRVH